MSIKITPQTHGIVTWSTNGGLQASGPMTVAEGTTFVLQELRPNGYRDAALRPLTDEEAAEFEASRLAFVATLEKHRKPVMDLDLTWIDEAGTERSYLEAPGATRDVRGRLYPDVLHAPQRADGLVQFFKSEEF